MTVIELALILSSNTYFELSQNMKSNAAKGANVKLQ